MKILLFSLIVIMSSILVLVIGQTAIYAQEVVNQNSLVACVDYFNREYET